MTLSCLLTTGGLICVSHGPETGHYTPSATWMFRQQWILMELQRGYVQDVRYTAGAWMRRSGAFQFCTLFEAGSAGAACVKLAQHSMSLILITQAIPSQPISWFKIITQFCLNRAGFGLVVITPSHQGRK